MAKLVVRIKDELIFDEIDLHEIAKKMCDAFWNSEYLEGHELEDLDEEDFDCLTHAVAAVFLDIVKKSK